jgi:hypothetical protein
MTYRRIMKMNKIIRGRLGIYKCEMIYEYSNVTNSWWVMPLKCYEMECREHAND